MKLIPGGHKFTVASFVAVKNENYTQIYIYIEYRIAIRLIYVRHLFPIFNVFRPFEAHFSFILLLVHTRAHTRRIIDMHTHT